MIKLQFISSTSVIFVQIIMMITIKCSDTLNFNGTYLDYGSELCFVIVFQISSLFLAIAISTLDIYWKNWVNFWFDSVIKSIIAGTLNNLIIFILP